MRNFRSTVLDEDLETVQNAWSDYKQSAAALYARHQGVALKAAQNGDQKLRKAADGWLEQAELVVATNFDLVYLPAQVKRLKKLDRDTSELEQVVEDVRDRNRTARAALPTAKSELEVAKGAR